MGRMGRFYLQNLISHLQEVLEGEQSKVEDDDDVMRPVYELIGLPVLQDKHVWSNLENGL